MPVTTKLLRRLLPALLALLATGCEPGSFTSSAPVVSTAPEPEVYTAVSDSRIFTMDRVYKSMFGPGERAVLKLPAGPPEVLWITGIEVEIVGADGESAESSEFFCHSAFLNRQTQPVVRQRMLGQRLGEARKLFTLVQGLTEVRFPEGFGLPVLSTESFENQVMVMNPSERAEPVRVGVDSRVDYVRDADLDRPMKPLFPLPLVTQVPISGQAIDHAGHDHAAHDPGGEHGDLSCLAGDVETETARTVDRVGQTAILPLRESESGVERTVHWYVPPGRHVYRHRLGALSDRLAFDTRAHYIFAHLHPFGESLELIDLTTGESVFKATARNYPDQVAVEEITHYSSTEGLPIWRDHEYEIVAIYDNTTDHDIDSMAVMYLYLHDTNQVAAGPMSRAGS